MQIGEQVSLRWYAACVLSLSLLAASAAPADTPGAGLTYPTTRTVGVVDNYFGTQVADPYRWLEDLDAPETADWIAAQNKVTFGYLDALPQRDEIRRRLTALWNYQKTGLPVLEAGQLWFAQNSGLQRQSPVYRQAGPGATQRSSSTLICCHPMVRSPWASGHRRRMADGSPTRARQAVPTSRTSMSGTLRPARTSRTSCRTRSFPASAGRRTTRDSSIRGSRARKHRPTSQPPTRSISCGITASRKARRIASSSSARRTPVIS